MTKETVYFIGFIKAGKKVIVQARKNKDNLSCELWRYFGQRITTKTRLKALKSELLIEINKSYKTEFKFIQVC